MQQKLYGEFKKGSPTSVLRVSDMVRTPVTFGLLNPCIIIPKAMLLENEGSLQEVLLHETIHIRRRDNIWKLLAVAAVCVHWFNPLVWLWCRRFNRDLELSCDEAVLKQLGETERKNYAITLISLAEQQRGTALFSGFGRDAIKERVEAIMKYKKQGITSILCGALLLGAAMTVFAADSVPENAVETETEQDVNGAKVETETEVSQDSMVYEEWDGKEENAIRNEEGKIVGIDVTADLFSDEETIMDQLTLQELLDSEQFKEYEKLGLRYQEEDQSLHFGEKRVAELTDPYADNTLLSWVDTERQVYTADDIDLTAVRDEEYQLQYFTYTNLEGFARMSDEYSDDAMYDEQLNQQMASDTQTQAETEETEDAQTQAEPEEMEETEAETDPSAYSVIGGADGPTSIFLAGKLEDGEDLAKSLYELKTEYVGDASAVGELIYKLQEAGLLEKGNSSFEILSEKEPYGIKLGYAQVPENEDLAMVQMGIGGSILLALIDNLSEVTISIPDYNIVVNVTEATKYLGQDVKEYGTSLEKFRELVHGTDDE